MSNRFQSEKVRELDLSKINKKNSMSSFDKPIPVKKDSSISQRRFSNDSYMKRKSISKLQLPQDLENRIKFRETSEGLKHIHPIFVKNRKHTIEGSRQSIDLNQGLKLSKLLDDSLNSDRSKKIAIINPKMKHKCSLLEKFIEKSKKNIEDEEVEFNENLPFKKKKLLRRSFSVKIKNEGNDNKKKKLSHSKTNVHRESKGKNHQVNVEETEEDIDNENKNQEKPQNSLKFQESLEESDSDDDHFLMKFKNVYDSFSDEEIFDLNKKNTDFFLLDKNTRKIIDIFMIFVIFYSCFTSFYSLAFSTTKLDFLFINECFLEVIFMFDMSLNFFTPFTNENDYIVKDFDQIAIYYFNSWFTIDFLSAIPFTILQYFFFNPSKYLNTYNTPIHLTFNFFSPFFIGKWLKILRIAKLIKYEFLSDLQFISENKLNRVFKSTFIFGILMYFSTCFWIYIGLIEYDIVNNWISYIAINSKQQADCFVASLYFNLVTVFTIGYGDITGRNRIETFYNIFLLLVGVMLFSFTVSSLSSLFGIPDSKTMVFQAKIDLLESMRNDYKLPTSLYKIIRQYIIMEFERNNNDRYELIESLPTNIKNELTIYMYKTIIKDLRFFNGQNSEFVIFVLPFLKSHKLHKGEILFSAGEFVEETYFVVRGVLALNLDAKYDHLEVAVIRENSHFGELLMLTNEQSPYELKCKSYYAEVLVLKNADFVKIKSSFNSNVMKILNESYKTLENVDKRRQQFLRLYDYEKSVEGVKQIMQKINIYLMEKGFKNYFYYDIDFENANDFLINNEFGEVMKIIEPETYFMLEDEDMKEQLKSMEHDKINKEVHEDKKKDYNIIQSTLNEIHNQCSEEKDLKPLTTFSQEISPGIANRKSSANMQFLKFLNPNNFTIKDLERKMSTFQDFKESNNEKKENFNIINNFLNPKSTQPIYNNINVINNNISNNNNIIINFGIFKENSNDTKSNLFGDSNHHIEIERKLSILREKNNQSLLKENDSSFSKDFQKGSLISKEKPVIIQEWNRTSVPKKSEKRISHQFSLSPLKVNERLNNIETCSSNNERGRKLSELNIPEKKKISFNNFSTMQNDKKDKINEFVKNNSKNIDLGKISKKRRKSIMEKTNESTMNKKLIKKSKTIFQGIKKGLEGKNLNLIKEETELKEKTLNLLNFGKTMKDKNNLKKDKTIKEITDKIEKKKEKLKKLETTYQRKMMKLKTEKFAKLKQNLVVEQVNSIEVNPGSTQFKLKKNLKKVIGVSFSINSNVDLESKEFSTAKKRKIEITHTLDEHENDISNESKINQDYLTENFHNVKSKPSFNTTRPDLNVKIKLSGDPYSKLIDESFDSQEKNGFQKLNKNENGIKLENILELLQSLKK